MVPLYAARIENLGVGDFVKVDCAACPHPALLTPAFLSRLGLDPHRKVLDLQDRGAMPGLRYAGPGCCVDQMGQTSRVIRSARIVLEVRLSFLLEPSHPRGRGLKRPHGAVTV
jgi:hypothetical protein